jgi:DNA-binding transcriptional LysR family regulator
MDWRNLAFDWNRARAFLVTAEEGSLSAAARALGMTQPTLGRQVSALEEELGVTLFDRVGRGLKLTPAGLGLVEHVRAMAEAAGRLSLAAGGQAQSIEGQIRLTASEIYCSHLLPPIIARLRAEAPGIEVEIVAANQAVDLRRREADIAIRSFRPTQPDLIARKLCDDRARLYAASRYLDRLGRPKGPSDLARFDFISFEDRALMIERLNAQGFDLTQRNFPLITASHMVHWALVKQGIAIGIVPEALGDREPGVERVLPDMAPMEFPMWLVAHRELATSRRVRLVFDLLADALRHGWPVRPPLTAPLPPAFGAA